MEIPFVLDVRCRAPVPMQKVHDPFYAVDGKDAGQWRFEADVLGHMSRDCAPSAQSGRYASARRRGDSDMLSGFELVDSVVRRAIALRRPISPRKMGAARFPHISLAGSGARCCSMQWTRHL
jgi:hypothetical protein